ncbi:MAG: type II secretion system F family protein [bacterium]
MPFFNYRAVKKDGSSYNGEMEAVDRFAVYKIVKDRGELVAELNEVSSSKGVEFYKNLSSRVDAVLGHIGTQEKINFAKNLGAMVSAGLSLSRALSVQEKQIRNKKFKDIVKSLNDEISRGKSLSEAMREYPKIFSDLFVSMVRAGEGSGGLSEALRIVALQMDNSNRLTKKIRGAMIYPSVIIGVIVIIAILMFVYVIPGITGTFKEMKVALPWSTQVIISISDFMKDHSVLVILLLLIISGVTYTWAKTKIGMRTIDYVILRIPVISKLVKQTNSARTARTLSSLITSGVPIGEALKITGEVVQNSYYRTVIYKAYEAIGKGEPMSKTFSGAENLYPIFVGEMMNVGEETGKTPEMLLGVATFYENEVEQATKDISTIIEPILMVFIGGAVGFFAISMITPIYSLMDTI